MRLASRLAISTAMPFVVPGGVPCVTKSGFTAMRATRSAPVGASSAFAAAGTDSGATVAQAEARSSRSNENARFISPPSVGTRSLRREEARERRVRLVRHLLGGIVAAGQHLAGHVRRALLPRVDGLVAAVHVALLA